jgi:hypothetical protein
MLISPSHSKTSWISIGTPAYTIPIGGAAVFLARRETPDPARLRLAMKLSLAVVALGLAGGVAFEVVLAILDPIDWWLDAGFYGLVIAGATTAILLWVAAREPAPVTPNAF